MKRIFLSGLFRSGTTLISRALSASTDIYISYQPLTPLFKTATNKLLNELGIDKGKPLGDPSIIQNHWDLFQKRVAETRYSHHDLSDLKAKFKESLENDISEKDSIWFDLFKRINGETFIEIFNSALSNYEEHINQNGVKRFIGIKEVWCEDFIPVFMQNGYKCIHIIRDPRGIIASRNYGRYLLTGCNNKKYPVLFICRSWNRSIRIFEIMSANPNYLMVQYEHFLKKPEKTMGLICDFLDIDFRTEMIDIRNFRGGDGEPWHGNVDSKRFMQIDSSRSDYWKNILTEDDIFLCEFLCCDEMRPLGYIPVSNYEDQERFMALKEDPNAATSWLSKYGHTLTEKQKTVEVMRKKA